MKPLVVKAEELPLLLELRRENEVKRYELVLGKGCKMCLNKVREPKPVKR